MAKYPDLRDIDQNLTILAEECAEVIQVIMKIKRFGVDHTHPKLKRSNREMLLQEIGDVQAMINVLVDNRVVLRKDIVSATARKIFRLRQWYKI